MSDFKFVPNDRLSVTSINNQQDMAKAVFDRYDTRHPIGIVKAHRGPQDKNDTYVLLLSGTEPVNFAQATTLPQDMGAAYNQNDRYRHSIMVALQESGIKKTDNLIIAGHSLGGMEAQNLVADKEFQAKYHASSVVTFGSPKTCPEQPGVHYDRFEVKGDPVVFASPGGALGFDRPKQIQVDDGVKRDPIGQHLSYPHQNQLSQHGVPGKKLELEPGSLKVYSAYQDKQMEEGFRNVDKALEAVERRQSMQERMREKSGRAQEPERHSEKHREGGR